MNFYQSIAKWYDRIFPFKSVQLDFIKKHMPTNGYVLDVGCGTGSLSVALQEEGYNVTAIDLDEEMLQKARVKSNTVDFRMASMLELDKYFEEEQFDAVYCFGNTLVHLLNLEEIEAALRQKVSLLKPNGWLLLQIVNYDRIYAHKLDGLPTIETNGLQFVRKYHYEQSSTSVQFETNLIFTNGNKPIKNTVPLFALRKSQVETILQDLDAQNISFYGNFQMAELNGTTQPLIVAARFA